MAPLVQVKECKKGVGAATGGEGESQKRLTIPLEGSQVRGAQPASAGAPVRMKFPSERARVMSSQELAASLDQSSENRTLSSAERAQLSQCGLKTRGDKESEVSCGSGGNSAR